MRNDRLGLAAAVLLGANSAIADVDEMKQLAVITGMTSYSTATGTHEVFAFRPEFVGRALVERERGVCDYRRNTLAGYKDLDLLKADGQTVTVQVPIIQKSVETGACADLMNKYFRS